MVAGNDLEGLIRFVCRDDTWHERLDQVLDEHLGPALEEFDVDLDDLDDFLGERWPMTLGLRLRASGGRTAARTSPISTSSAGGGRIAP